MLAGVVSADLLSRVPLGGKPLDQLLDLIGIEHPGAGLATFAKYGLRQQDACPLRGERLEGRVLPRGALPRPVVDPSQPSPYSAV